MYVRDIMTPDPVTVPSNASVFRAKRVMEKNKLRRLPVVDDGKLVGVITRDRLEKISPPETGRSMWELTYSIGSLYRTPVRQIMEQKVVTATPDMTAEEALALAQSKKVGSLIVVEDGKVVGIVTTNDFFYRIVNKVLGIGEPGCRIEVAGGGEGKELEKIISTINRLGLKIITLHIIAAPQKPIKDIVVHIDCDNVEGLIAELTTDGFKVDVRRR